MSITLEQAEQMAVRRDAAMKARDIEAYMGLWSDDCVDEGPAHCFDKDQLRAAIEAAFSAMKPVEMVTRSLAVQGDAMFYEFAIVWESRSTGKRHLQTGMTWHELDSDGRWCRCREYWDPAETPRPSVAGAPEIAALLGG